MNKVQRKPILKRELQLTLAKLEDKAVEYFINGKKTTKKEYFRFKDNASGQTVDFECRESNNRFKYKGEYDKSNGRHGFGTFVLSVMEHSYTYEGYFYKNAFHGNGKLTASYDKGNSVYEGNFSNGFKHGQGKEIEKFNTSTSPDKVETYEYEGNYKLDCKTGYGTGKIIEFNGNITTYVGHFKDGVPHGQGKEVCKCKSHTQDNLTQESSGNFNDGQLNGKGVFIVTNLQSKIKLEQKGNFKENKLREGVSCIYNLDDNKLKEETTGTFKNNRLNGYCVRKDWVGDDCFVTKGIFVDGKLKDGTSELKGTVVKYKNFNEVEEKDTTPKDIEKAVRLSKRKQIKEALEKHFPIRARKTQARKKHIAETKKIFSKKIDDDGGFKQYFDCGKFGLYIEVKDLLHTYDISHVKKKGNEVNFTKSFDTVNELIECYYNFNGSFHSVKEFEAKPTARQTREIQEHLQNQAEEARRRNIEQEQQRTMFKRQQIEYEWDYLKSLRENAGLSAKKGESLKSVNERRQEFEQDKTVVELDKRGNKRKRKISKKADKRKARTKTKRSRK